MRNDGEGIQVGYIISVNLKASVKKMERQAKECSLPDT